MAGEARRTCPQCGVDYYDTEAACPGCGATNPRIVSAGRRARRGWAVRTWFRRLVLLGVLAGLLTGGVRLWQAAPWQTVIVLQRALARRQAGEFLARCDLPALEQHATAEDARAVSGLLRLEEQVRGNTVEARQAALTARLTAAVENGESLAGLADQVWWQIRWQAGECPLGEGWQLTRQASGKWLLTALPAGWLRSD